MEKYPTAQDPFHKLSFDNSNLKKRKTKRNLISSIGNLLHELLHELPISLGIMTLGNKEILEKCGIWVEIYPSTQSPLMKLHIGSRSQKTRKYRYQTFLILSVFTGFQYFILNFLPRINRTDNILEICKVLVQIHIFKNKKKRDIQYRILGIRVFSQVVERLST